MVYSKFKDLDLSYLGFGAMRLPTTAPRGPIDEERAIELVRFAYEQGVNIFDTAFFYHGGGSELLLRKALSQFPRDTWYLADKFPGHFIEHVPGGFKLGFDFLKDDEKVFKTPLEIFERQLKCCGVDHFDFYMIQCVAESSYDLYTDEKYGVVECMLEQKKAGRIRHLGLSTHARADTLAKFLDIYDCFEYAMIQLNYLDWTLQEAGKKYEIATKHGMPVFVMEPVRGGKLADPGEEAAAILKEAKPDDTLASWAFKYLQTLPNVAVVFSGMTTMEQLNENLETFSKHDPLTEPELATLQRAANSMAEFVPCTECRYCNDACTLGLDIAKLITIYNEAAVEVSWLVHKALGTMTDAEKPGACSGCAECCPVCPQGINIPDIMRKFERLIRKD